MRNRFTSLLSGNVRSLIVVAGLIVAMVAVFFVLREPAAGQTVTSKDTPEGNELWQDVNEGSLSVIGQRQIVPEKYRVVGLNRAVLGNLLAVAPAERDASFAAANNVISFPMPDGGFSRFRFYDSPIMEQGLSDKYPELHTYSGQGIDEPSATVRFDVTPAGFHALILWPEGSVFIDPYAKGDTDNYISYFKRDFSNPDKHFVCLTGTDMKKAFELKSLSPPAPEENIVGSGGTLHTYRLAMAATGEYTAFQGGTKALALAAIVTTVNRVNTVYERDLSVRLVLIANDNLIIYTNAATDPYANTSGDLNANQTTINSVIGSSNYDVGHLVGTGGGGVAQLRVPCVAGSKAMGLTGSSSPVGDPFDIDYVAHEMGHQFGGNHTFNSTAGSCGGGNRAGTAAYEPGSASTIQGYAGICDAQDLQRNSDDYFHVKSLEEMIAFINGTGETCDVDTANGNAIPAVNAAPACTIPIQTPFSLTGSATDANSDSLTYTWEEYDLGSSTTAVPNTDATGVRPVFRSYKPSASGATRTFPSLPFILNNANVPPSTFSGTNAVGTFCSFGNCMTGELLPAITRTMNFQLTVRDNRGGGGAVRSAQTAVNVSAVAGPFAVTSPNTAVTWASSANQTVTWNVASTTAAPVSCPNVDILLSYDGGTTFPTTLAAATANDGSQSVAIPSTATTTARVKIRCSTSCWFDISNTNFSLTAPTAAGVSIDGRVVTAAGFAVGRLTLVLTDQNGSSRTAITNPFGYFRFEDVPAGETYVLSGGSKQYSIASQTLTVADEISGLILTATAGN